jgi:ATP-dependent Clp protease ATP-binding subunit ClpA
MRWAVFEIFEGDARRWVLAAAEAEARRRGDRRLGTDHLLLALFHDPKALAAGLLGVDLDRARAAAEGLDRAALAAIGVDLGDSELPAVPAPARRRLSWTSGARAVLVATVAEARRTKSRRISTRHLLLALLALRRPDPAGQLLDALGVDAAAARAALQSP